MSRKNIRTIIKEMIEVGWDSRRDFINRYREANNKKAKEWKERERLGLNNERERRSNYQGVNRHN